jgi:hypothetical protein
MYNHDKHGHYTLHFTHSNIGIIAQNKRSLQVVHKPNIQCSQNVLEL